MSRTQCVEQRSKSPSKNHAHTLFAWKCMMVWFGFCCRAFADGASVYSISEIKIRFGEMMMTMMNFLGVYLFGFEESSSSLSLSSTTASWNGILIVWNRKKITESNLIFQSAKKKFNIHESLLLSVNESRRAASLIYHLNSSRRRFRAKGRDEKKHGKSAA